MWKDPENGFVIYENDEARVLFIGSKSLSTDSLGIRPTTSEGMAYGLLLAVANNDQKLFNQFLKYYISVANEYGCQNTSGPLCNHHCYYLMPWIVDETKRPYFYQSSLHEPSIYSSGSASDADIQIAWALSLASKKVCKKQWKDCFFITAQGKLSYKEILKNLYLEISLFDVDLKTNFLLPGNQWEKEGNDILFPGYITPQALYALNSVKWTDYKKTADISDKNISLTIQNNSINPIKIDTLQGVFSCDLETPIIIMPYTSWRTPLSTKIEKPIKIKAYSCTYPIKSYLICEIKNDKQKWKCNTKNSTQDISSSIDQNNIKLTIQDGTSFKQVDFEKVYQTLLKRLICYQNTEKTSLIPNKINFCEKSESNWDHMMSFDAMRFLLWVPASKNLKIDADLILQKINQNKLIESKLIKCQGMYTFPEEGINAYTGSCIKEFNSPMPALNAPILVFAYFTKQKDLFEKLLSAVSSYDISKNTPKKSDATGDSSPYYNAAILLLAKALLENRL
ncbi:MAG TPA: glycosyl hydrolase family 8 [Chlamydiales bacterium]|nr:glycosyl hydrolase family 8 [Chlamydiales bacterium]